MNNRKIKLIALLALLLAALCVCTAVEEALGKLGEEMESAQVETPQNNGGEIEWGFVPVVRELAVETFDCHPPLRA